MGYLANKKHEARVNAFLRAFLALSGAMSLLAFGSARISFFLDEYRWQLYLLITAVFFYCLLRRFFVYALLAFVLGTVNYFAVSSAVGVFGSSSNSKDGIRLLFGTGTDNPEIVAKAVSDGGFHVVALSSPRLDGRDLKDSLPEKYSFLHPAEGWEDGFMLISLPVEVSGRVNLGETGADFAKVLTDGRAQIFISVDFAGLSRQKTARALDNLSAFIRRQDDPVIIFGNFNTVAWSKTLGGFIAKNGLQVKNALTDNVRSLILPPRHYILGYEQNNVSGSLLMPYLNSFSPFTRF